MARPSGSSRDIFPIHLRKASPHTRSSIDAAATHRKPVTGGTGLVKSVTVLPDGTLVGVGLGRSGGLIS